MKQSILQLSAKDLRGKSGVYLISCNERCYIGSSKSLYDRLLEHRIKLINQYHSNDFMMKACKKYGITNFQYEILELCEPDKRIEREKCKLRYCLFGTRFLLLQYQKQNARKMVSFKNNFLSILCESI